MDYKDLANLIFPDAKEISYYEEKYPERDLPEGAIVTRFAPSPTGFVHIGGLYQSLIARKLASQTNGVFFLRVEDTDQKREVENAVSGIVSSLKDFAIEPDEGMISEEEGKGNYGPYSPIHSVSEIIPSSGAISNTFNEFTISVIPFSTFLF